MFRDLERAQTVFTGLAAHVLFGANLSNDGQTLTGEGELVSGSYFPVLGVQPALGRLLGPQDDRTVGESPVVVLSHAYWQTRFAASPAVLDARMIVNGQPMTIVGVAPRGFGGTTLGSKPAVFVPITLRGLMQPNFKGFDDRKSFWAYLFARLQPGVSIEQARDGYQCTVSSPDQRHRRAAAENERADAGAIQGQADHARRRIARTEHGGGQGEAAADAAARRHRARAADRLRQHRQPAGRARRRAQR